MPIVCNSRKNTHVSSIWKWVQRYSDHADRLFRTDKRLVKGIIIIFVVDETPLLQIDGGCDYCWLWIAYEPNLDVCLMMHLSRERTIFVCYQFFKQLRKKFGRKPIFTDGAQWYNDACKWLRLQHHVYGTRLKNLMERFIQHIKDRTEECCFDDHFRCRKKKENCDRQHVWNWLKMFLLYQNMAADRIRFMMFLIGGGSA
jgi:putative transposase